MVWFKVDDNLSFHAKVVAAGNAAMGLWVRAGAWSAQQLTEGFVPEHIAATMGTRGEAARLVASGLWLEEPGGFRFWQWAKDGRQPTREQVEAKRTAARDRQQRARDKALSSRRDGAVTDGVTGPLVTLPRVTSSPTRPDPTVNTETKNVSVLEPRKRGTPESDTAQTIVAEWIDHSAKRPPGQVVGQVAKHVGQMLAEGIDPDDVRRGLAAWMSKGLHPSALASVVNEVMNRPKVRTPVAAIRPEW